MKIYTAAVFTNNYCRGQRHYEDLNEREKEILNNLPNILESYHYVGKEKMVDQMRQVEAKIFLDSGAFSAYNLGVELSLTAYCEYIKRNMDLIRVEDDIVLASVLDGIGDALTTYRNQLQMERLGVRALPCFHAGEDERYLEYYVANYSYITLGGLVGSNPQQLAIWLDRMWDRYLTDGAGRPKLKVHGFGITSIPLMERYPWYSCDSSSWIQATSFGSIITPDFGPLWISDKSPSRHDAGQHISTLTQIEQREVIETIERDGFTYERLSTSYKSRAAFNLFAFGRIQEKITEKEKGIYPRITQELF